MDPEKEDYDDSPDSDELPRESLDDDSQIELKHVPLIIKMPFQRERKDNFGVIYTSDIYPFIREGLDRISAVKFALRPVMLSVFFNT